MQLRLRHSDLTTEEVVSGIIEWPLPPVMSLYSCVKMASSVNVAVTNTTDMVTIKVKTPAEEQSFRLSGGLHSVAV